MHDFEDYNYYNQDQESALNDIDNTPCRELGLPEPILEALSIHYDIHQEENLF